MRRLLNILIVSLFTFATAKAQEIAVDSITADTVTADTTVALIETVQPLVEPTETFAPDSLLAMAIPNIPEVADHRSIYCHPYSTKLNVPDWKRMWTNTAVLSGAYVGTLLVLQCLPADATSWNRAEITGTPMFKRWYRNVFKLGPEWDHDNPIFNFVLHPYAGAVYFMSARSCGFNFWRSMLYSACVSTIGWEFGIEAFMERPSIQDIFITPLVGSAIGEAFYKAKRSIVANDYHLFGSKFLGNVAVFLVDPINEVIDLFRGRNTKCAGNGWSDPSQTDMAYDEQPESPSVEGSLTPFVTGSYKGFSLKITF
ncbi:DUF3943 domain-containing protein [uncultured Duncaniella sp.]|uniref:DUF3943 domain-containing protein n=1 Tax=uncultured Duncaniella sp. TaxID=2768039 RepID=UPI0026F3FC1D|nr:DUF3943 domain-containing protein [uncultured Duncaniella sp.]MCI9172928.1 DUF3943 domain-containing protein [Muribaculaceae bacterium]